MAGCTPSVRVALISSFAAVLAPAGVLAQTDSPSNLRLSGGIVHSERLDPLPPGERPGDFYNPSLVPQPLVPQEPVEGAVVKSSRPYAAAAIKGIAVKTGTVRGRTAKPVRSGYAPPIVQQKVAAVKPVQLPVLTKPAMGKEPRFPVPPWLAGVWLRMEAKELTRTELPSGKSVKPVGTQIARVRDAFGTYRDMNGQVWQVFDRSRSVGQVDRGQALDVHRVHSYELRVTGPKSAVVKVKATHTMVNKASRKIISVYQDEELNTYSPLPDGRIATDSSVKVFDVNGKPFLLTRTVSAETRTAPRNWPPPQSGIRTFNIPRPQYLNSPAQFSLEQWKSRR